MTLCVICLLLLILVVAVISLGSGQSEDDQSKGTRLMVVIGAAVVVVVFVFVIVSSQQTPTQIAHGKFAQTSHELVDTIIRISISLSSWLLSTALGKNTDSESQTHSNRSLQCLLCHYRSEILFVPIIISNSSSSSKSRSSRVHAVQMVMMIMSIQPPPPSAE